MEIKSNSYCTLCGKYGFGFVCPECAAKDPTEDDPCCKKPKFTYGLTRDQWICTSCGTRSRDRE